MLYHSRSSTNKGENWDMISLRGQIVTIEFFCNEFVFVLGVKVLLLCVPCNI